MTSISIDQEQDAFLFDYEGYGLVADAWDGAVTDVFQ